MANPQKENGYTEIANEILEHLVLPGINGSEYRVLIFVIRKTYGFKKKIDRISLSQFQKNLLMKRANAIRTIKSLVAKRILLKDENSYKFNKNWEEWVVAKRIPSSQKDNEGSSQKDTYKRKDTKEILSTKVDSKAKLPQDYKIINSLLIAIKETLGIESFAEPQGRSRMFANHCLKKYGEEETIKGVEWIKQNWSSKPLMMKTIYYGLAEYQERSKLSGVTQL